MLCCPIGWTLYPNTNCDIRSHYTNGIHKLGYTYSFFEDAVFLIFPPKNWKMSTSICHIIWSFRTKKTADRLQSMDKGIYKLHFWKICKNIFFKSELDLPTRYCWGQLRQLDVVLIGWAGSQQRSAKQCRGQARHFEMGGFCKGWVRQDKQLRHLRPSTTWLLTYC